MFQNILYFIVALLIVSIPSPQGEPALPVPLCLGLLLGTWLLFAALCRRSYAPLRQQGQGPLVHEGLQAAQALHYQRVTFRLSLLALVLFAAALHLLEVKAWLAQVPGISLLETLQDLGGMLLFLVYLATIWYFAAPAHGAVFALRSEPWPFVRSHLRTNLPLLFPWLILSALYDLVKLTPWGEPERFLGRPEGEVLFLAASLVGLMLFMPAIITWFWRCRPFEETSKILALKAFLREKGFRCRGLLRWPLFEGRMLTAGIMGILPRYRYILMTDALVELLNVEELKAVLAHEIGHARYRHLPAYLVFFLGFMVLSFGLSDLALYGVMVHPAFLDLLMRSPSEVEPWFYLFVAVPLLAAMLVYFRYVMGFFMRHFERQADLYSAVLMGSPAPTIVALEKVAHYSGKIRELPSWHHFSIAQRVKTLARSARDPGLARRHNRFLAIALGIYLLGMGSLGYLLYASPFKDRALTSFLGTALEERLKEDPGNVALLEGLAMIYHGRGRIIEAKRVYERILRIAPDHAMALNNLAWILLTQDPRNYQDVARALQLAERAVRLERIPAYLDTLAEACYQAGQKERSVALIREALSLARENRDYYEGQLKKFLGRFPG